MDDRTKKMLIFAALVIAILIISSLVYLGFPARHPAEEEPKAVIDDRISPLENQGLILEVKRIRDRSILEKLMEPGTAWKTQPMFYFISNMDGLEYVSKDVKSATGESEILFEGWDTMFQENKIMKDVDEEQKTSKVTLTIVKRVPKGLLGHKSEDIEREKIHVAYNYSTGRWTGDDRFKDADGYGHYVGEYFEVWFNLYQTDYDNDGIPYWTEVNILHTDPRVDDSYSDPDNDGIPTAREWKWGYDPHVWNDHVHLDPDIDGIENVEEYKMAKWFADPFSQDIYIEADGMERGGLFDRQHVFFKESQQALIERFCQHGINVYIDDGWPGGPTNGGGELLPHYNTVSQDSGVMLQFYDNHFSDERKGVFRYFVVAHSSGFCHPSKFNKYDTFSVDTSRRNMFSLARHAPTPRLQRLCLAASVMHELGHSLGITPWTIQGCDNMSFAESREAKKSYQDTWCDYYSVMNYYYIYDYKLVDYSDGSNGQPYDQNDWEQIYLPTFRTECSVVEDPRFDPPGADKIVDEKVGISLDGWDYNEKLTKQYMEDMSGQSPVKSIPCNWSVYEKTDSLSGGMNLRIYAKLAVPYSEWILVMEGYVDDGGNMNLYQI
ncbi:MAG: hypothetical protein U9O96_00590 [Candidatus Thermoplasmatota archaeon]|nr:hypothetical protein [Candidatus Thermoplasmatota archaeon]